MQESHRLHAVQSPIIPVIADLIRRHPGTISLGQGVVNYGPPPEAFAQVARMSADSSNHKYQGVAGLPDLLEAIGRKLEQENGLRVDASNRVIVTAGGNQAFFNAVLAIADPGDEIILPSPYYFNHEMAVTILGGRPVLAPTDDNFQLQPEAIRAALSPRTRAVVTVSPNNPSGAVYPPAALREINELCAARGLYHLHDEAYEYFTYDGAEPFSPASLPGAAAHTISLFSLSKAYGFASWRIGWMVLPAGLEAAVRKIQDTILICPPVVSQFAALGALQAGRAYARRHLRDLTATRAAVQAALGRIEGCTVPRADGAFYFLVRVPTDRPALDVAEWLIREHGVAVIPGNAFGLDEGCTLRVAYASRPPEEIFEGVERLGRGLNALIRGAGGLGKTEE